MISEDKWVWKDGDSVEYSVNSTYGFLKSVIEGESSSLYNFFWKTKALPSAYITAWRVLENKIATKVNLARRGVTVDSTVCFFCREIEETTSNLFFECKVALLVWNLCYDWVGMKWANHLESASHFLHFNLIDAPAAINLAFGNIWITLVNDIWHHRNKHIFKGAVIDHSEIFSLAQLKVWSWVTSKDPLACFSFSDWCLDPLVCMFSIKNK